MTAPATDAAVQLPPEADRRWRDVSVAANAKKVKVEVRVAPGIQPILTPNGDLHGSFTLYGVNRGGVSRKVGEASSFFAATEALRAWVDEQLDLGADVLRHALQEHARRLALLTPRELSQKKRGHDHPIYADFRDRILPLAWDNLIDAVRVEALEDFVRKVGETTVDPERVAVDDWRELAAEARGLVAPK